MGALAERGIGILGPVDIGAGTRSIYVIDPNNIRLELSWQPADGDMPGVRAAWAQGRAEILAELRDLDPGRDWSATIAHLAE